MVLKLPADIHSADQLQFCAEELRRYAAAAAGAARAEESPPLPELSPESQILQGLLPASERQNSQSLEDLRLEIEKLITQWPSVSITLAAPAPRALKAELTGWLRQNIRPDLLVSFNVNPDIAGGMLIRTTNRVFDFSFRKLLLARPARFTEVLENV